MYAARLKHELKLEAAVLCLQCKDAGHISLVTSHPPPPPPQHEEADLALCEASGSHGRAPQLSILGEGHQLPLILSLQQI